MVTALRSFANFPFFVSAFFTVLFFALSLLDCENVKQTESARAQPKQQRPTFRLVSTLSHFANR